MESINYLHPDYISCAFQHCAHCCSKIAFWVTIVLFEGSSSASAWGLVNLCVSILLTTFYHFGRSKIANFKEATFRLYQTVIRF